MKSHRVVQWLSQTRGLQAAEAFYAALSDLHFIQGKKLNDPTLLAETARSIVGVPTPETLAFLASEDTEPTAATIQKAYDACHRLGITSIPTFIINGTHVINGAAHADEFTHLLRSLHHNFVYSPPIFADILDLHHLQRDDALFEPRAPFLPCA